jgi:hypothetical protein
MVFNSNFFHEQPGQTLSEDRFRQVELAVGFRELVCHRCDFSSFYRYKTIQVRRRPELSADQDEETRADQREIWRQIPRFAEIPETVHCRRCNEVLGLYTSCLY